MSDSEIDTEPSPDPEEKETKAVVGPRLVISRKKTVFVFAKDDGDAEEEEEEEVADFYDFTEIDTKFRIINDLDD